MFDLDERDIQRFWSKVNIRSSDECWPWRGGTVSKRGYGNFKHRSGKNIVSSRISCFLAHGPADRTNINALHSCDNPPCCNPAHLRWGTQKDNVADAIARSRHVNPPDVRSNPEWLARQTDAMPKGGAVHNAILTEEIVRVIWSRHLNGIDSSTIARETGATVNAVYDVCRGRTWRHLEGAPTIDALKAGGVRRGARNQFTDTMDTRSVHPRSKLTNDEVQKVKDRLARGEGWRTIAADYGISRVTVYRMRHA